MGPEGLSAVENPSEMFLRERSTGGVSSAVTVTMEGTRPLLLEVQGLCSPAQQVCAQKMPERGASFPNRVPPLPEIAVRAGLQIHLTPALFRKCIAEFMRQHAEDVLRDVCPELRTQLEWEGFHLRRFCSVLWDLWTCECVVCDNCEY